jgi:hypothetical protein
MLPAYPRAEMQRRIVETLERGSATLREMETWPGWPSRQTVRRWAAEDPLFDGRLKAALAWRRGLKRELSAGPSFNAPVAEEMLRRVRLGDAVRVLVRTPLMPDRDQLNRWKRERPDFAAGLAAAAAFSRSLRTPRCRRFDPEAADRIIVRLSKGETLAEVLADPELPGITNLRRWRRQRPDFDHAVKMAHLAGHRRRMRRRWRLTPKLRERILFGLVRGASLSAVCRGRGMPHRVTVQDWLRRDADFARDVGWARREGVITLGDQACEIAEAATEATVADARRAVGELYKRVGRMAPRPPPR